MPTKKRLTSKRTKRTASRTGASRGAVNVRGAKTKARVKGKQARPRNTGSIRQAAAKVVKSGARLVQHTGQRMIVAGAKKLEGALQSAADATSSTLHSVVDRVRIAGKH